MRLLETLAGQGHVFDGTQKLSDVNYELRIYQEEKDATSHASTTRESIGGLKEMELDLSDGYFPVGSKLTLRLEDARRVDFWVLSVNSFKPTGSFY